MKTNKEVIEALVAYFKEHADFETLARALANQMIDMNRIRHWNNLLQSEKECLEMRLIKNSDMLQDFIKNGSTERFWLKNLETKE